MFTSLKIFVFLTVLTGIVYPLLITGIGRLIFPHQANGSLIVRNGQIIGSELIAQKSDTSIYFSSRPSAIGYNPLPSGGSNLGLTSKKLKDTFHYRRNQFVMVNQLDSTMNIPSEMIFASGSGLDPDISPTAAFLQVDRIAKLRGFSSGQKERLLKVISDQTRLPQFGLLGELRINVLLLNIATDKIGSGK
jgi:K+-transporting ATPase ATPase C chain